MRRTTGSRATCSRWGYATVDQPVSAQLAESQDSSQPGHARSGRLLRHRGGG